MLHGGQDGLTSFSSDENPEPTTEEIHEYARLIGIDPIAEARLLWIAEQGIAAPLPPEWKPVPTHDGELYFFNFKTGESLWEHPLDDHFRQMVLEERRKDQLANAKKPISPAGQQKQIATGRLAPLAPLNVNTMPQLRPAKLAPLTAKGAPGSNAKGLSHSSNVNDMPGPKISKAQPVTLALKPATPAAERPKTARGHEHDIGVEEKAKAHTDPPLAIGGGQRFLKKNTAGDSVPNENNDVAKAKVVKQVSFDGVDLNKSGKTEVLTVHSSSERVTGSLSYMDSDDDSNENDTSADDAPLKLSGSIMLDAADLLPAIEDDLTSSQHSLQNEPVRRKQSSLATLNALSPLPVRSNQVVTKSQDINTQATSTQQVISDKPIMTKNNVVSSIMEPSVADTQAALKAAQEQHNLAVEELRNKHKTDMQQLLKELETQRSDLQRDKARLAAEHRLAMEGQQAIFDQETNKLSKEHEEKKARFLEAAEKDFEALRSNVDKKRLHDAATVKEPTVTLQEHEASIAKHSENFRHQITDIRSAAEEELRNVKLAHEAELSKFNLQWKKKLADELAAQEAKAAASRIVPLESTSTQTDGLPSRPSLQTAMRNVSVDAADFTSPPAITAVETAVTSPSVLELHVQDLCAAVESLKTQLSTPIPHVQHTETLVERPAPAAVDDVQTGSDSDVRLSSLTSEDDGHKFVRKRLPVHLSRTSENAEDVLVRARTFLAKHRRRVEGNHTKKRSAKAAASNRRRLEDDSEFFQSVNHGHAYGYDGNVLRERWDGRFITERSSSLPRYSTAHELESDFEVTQRLAELKAWLSDFEQRQEAEILVRDRTANVNLFESSMNHNF